MPKKFWLILLVPFSILLTILAHGNPAATERWFSMGFYRFWTETFGRLFGWIPFSVSQFLIILLPIGAVVYIGYTVWCLIAKKGKRKEYSLRFVANTACTLGILAILFTLGAGLNYGRLELSDSLGLDVRPSSTQELAALTEELVAEVNRLAPLVARNEHGHMVIAARSYTALSTQAREIFRNAGENIPLLRGYVPHSKPILYSHFMSRLRIAGVFSPFTLEAHVNVHMLDYHIPSTMLHELAHIRGIMREDEANFIAWLVGKDSGNYCFMYSSAMMALSYAANALFRANREEHSRIMAELHYYVRLDRHANWEYWQQFTGPLAEISQNVNDAYLRANRQEDGVQSYGRVVDLMLAYRRD